jgi:hypothetical protein
MCTQRLFGCLIGLLALLFTAEPLNAATLQETFQEGGRLYQQGLYKEALERYQAVDALSPGLWQVKQAIGHCCVRLGRTQEALAVYEQSLAIHPDPALQNYVENLKTRLPVPAPLSTAVPAQSAKASAPSKITKTVSSGVVYLGIPVLPGKFGGMTDAVLSDRLYTNPEGRVTLSLGDSSKSRRMTGIELGGEFPLRRRLAFVLEGRMSPHRGSSQTSLGLAGLNFHLAEKKRFVLGLAPKAGYGTYYADAGNADLVPGTTPPVLLPEGMVSDGDPVKVRARCVLTEVALQGYWKAGSRAGLYGRLGYLKALATRTSIQTGGVWISPDHPGLLKSDGSGLDAGLHPTGGLDGLTAFIGVAFFR